ncbi:tRNA lysidine(34) synthetase TilS [Anaplasma capra]|uniref:tRNA lysidine(34) synthetase TilS n=1 Tax=Anaplasma capra TaxID=1562740 RepID=UPI0021D5B09C|nr:tRNA lysidine(34) synthetase TilS [Anaplasma capra]MCU7611303.1 tRNA lysidine(34) synthetase TilS [Anaplasma capra]MCU7612744.1 tRNA lysidine(34) synthetase TilS [Anaplasma capra]
MSGVRIPLFPRFKLHGTTKLESKVLTKLSSLDLGNNYAIAVSGGVDSMVLLNLVCAFHRKEVSGFPTVLTVNHGFRAEAEDETHFVQEHASKLGMDCEILTWGRRRILSKSQEVAREIRYSLLHQWCVEHSVKFLLTAHNKSDQAETVLINLERGSGIDGLSGMHERSVFGNITICRPLLDFTRQQILEYAIQKQLSWVEDPSNRNPNYRRTFFRNFIADSDDPGIIVDRLCRTASHMHRALSCILHYVQSSLDHCLEFSPLGFITVKSQAFCSVPEEVASRLLLLSLMAMGGKDCKPRYSSFWPIFTKMWREGDLTPCTIHGCKIRKDPNGNFAILREVAHIRRKAEVRTIGETMQWDHRFSIRVVGVHDSSVTNGVPHGSGQALGAPSTQHGLHIEPLGDRLSPEHLRHINRDIACSFPVLVHRDKVLAYPWQNHNIKVVPVINVEEVLVRRGVVNLICNQLYQ